MEEKKKCAYEYCNEVAEIFVCGRENVCYEDAPAHPTPAMYCRTHAKMVIDEANPEYHVYCPNCGCGFGVN